MQITVLTDDKGKIIGTMRSKSGHKDAPTRAGISPQKGQQVHKIELSEDIAKEPLKLHGRTVQVKGERAQLVA